MGLLHIDTRFDASYKKIAWVECGMVILDFVAAVLLGALSGMGIGGGGLLVIYLTLVRSVDQISAQGLNLFFFIFASAAALFVHLTKRHIPFGILFFCSAFGMVAAYFGAAAANAVDPALVRKLFGGMLMIAGGIALLRNVSAWKRTKAERNGKKS